LAEAVPEDTRGELKQTWDLFISVRMLKVVPLMIWSAVSLAIFSAIFIPFFTDSMTGKASKTETKDALISMSMLGVGSIVGSALWGYLQDKIKEKATAMCNLVALALAVAVLLIYNVNDKYTMWLSFILTFTWGLQDSGINCFIGCICGF
jgi:sugar phosphate permease